MFPVWYFQVDGEDAAAVAGTGAVSITYLKKRILVQNQGSREYQTGGMQHVLRGFDMSAQRQVWAKRLFCDGF